MRIAIIAPPFISVPPKVYGGTELFIAQLAKGAKQKGVDIVVYTNGQSTVPVEKRWLFKDEQWPLQGEIYDNLKDVNHTTWSVCDAATDCDLIHLNNVGGLAYSRFVDLPFVYTMHHPHLDEFSKFFSYFPKSHYVTISDFQRAQEKMPNMRTIHHGIDISLYKAVDSKQHYLSFIGRIAPVKGTHIAIEVAKRAGIPLKIAGEVQPLFRDYFEQQIKPHLDGKMVEYIGPADLAAKNELLGNSMAMLFPILWDEPFGLVMIEAMACGTPVLAFRRGSTPEVVTDGVSGYLCQSPEDMAQRATTLKLPATRVREYAQRLFSVERMVDDYVSLYSQIVAAGQGTGYSVSTGEEPAVA